MLTRAWCVLLLSQKEVLAKREDDRRKRFMKDQRHKTIQRVKQYMEVSAVIN